MKKLILHLILLLIGVLFYGCNYDFLKREDLPVPDPTNPTKFSEKIIPIFENRCLECHNTGGTAPDLTAANAYNSIISMSLVNTENPINSKIYDYVIASTPNHAWRKYTNAQANLVLKWIQEGALNN